MDILSGLGHLIWTIISGLLMLTVLVYVHELGHYLAAKSFGMKVNAFAIMMGGVRKTQLDSYLHKPLIPSKFVAFLFGGGFLIAVIGAALASQVTYLAGICTMGIIVPAWVMLRLGALYHLPKMKVPILIAKCVGVGIVVLAIGTKLQGLSVDMIIGIICGSTIIALMIVYYFPIQMKERDEDVMGLGEITVINPTKPIEVNELGEIDSRESTVTVPVRYRPVWSRIGKDGTEYSLLVLPLGGFAAIHGMQAKADGSEQQIEQGFYSKHAWKRLVVLFAGPLFSILFGFFLLFGLYSTIGKMSPVNRPVIGEVGKEGKAILAGLKVNDKILAVDGQEVITFFDVIKNVRDKWKDVPGEGRVGIPIVVTYERASVVNSVQIIPDVDTEPRALLNDQLEESDKEAIQSRLGIGYKSEYKNFTAMAALKEAIYEPFDMAKGVFKTFTQPKEAKKNLSGPTIMAQATSAAVTEGFAMFLWFGAMLSISLGIMNLLPVVPLDGGQMVVATIELFRKGRRLSFNLQNLLANVGIAFLVVLMLFGTAIDLGRKAEVNKETAKKSSPQIKPLPQSK